MRRLAMLVVVVAVIAGVTVYVQRTNEPDPEIAGLAPTSVNPFGPAGDLAPGPFDAAYDRSGSRLAVRSETGVSLAQRGKLQPITETGLEVTAYAWMPSAQPSVIYAEAPGNTGQLRLANAEDATPIGFVPLDPVVNVRGISVASDRRHAVLIIATRETLATRDRLDLATADLTDGTVTPMPLTDGDELSVQHVDDERVLLKVATATGAEAVVHHLATGQRERLSRDGEEVEHAGVLANGRFIAYSARTRPRPEAEPGDAVLWAVPPAGGDHVKMGEAGESTVVAIDPRGGIAVVTDLVAETDDTFARRLRRIVLDPLPGPPEVDEG